MESNQASSDPEKSAGGKPESPRRKTSFGRVFLILIALCAAIYATSYVVAMTLHPGIFALMYAMVIVAVQSFLLALIWQQVRTGLRIAWIFVVLVFALQGCAMSVLSMMMPRGD